MHEVYISGALTNIGNPIDCKRFYEAIGRLCIGLGLKVYVPHKETDPVDNADLAPQQVFVKDKQLTGNSKLIIAYVGIPSLGVGMELAYADVKNIPIILLYEKEAHISRFPRGIPSVIAEIAFADYDDALKQLVDTIESWQAQSSSAYSVHKKDF